MTHDVAVLNRNDLLVIADDLMNLGRIRHLPVVADDGEEVVGILSQRDLLRGAIARMIGYGEFAQQKLLKQLSVKEVMTSRVTTIGPNASAAEAAQLMVDHKIGCVVVVEAGKLAGILTETDILKAYLQTA
jgi:CBS domain-containing protein